jgi:ribosomal protein S18 acetylase RimI-like enzyme
VGAALLKTAGKFLSQQGIVQISLRVGKSNHAAMRFYQKLGFQKRNEYLVMDRKR